MNKANVKQTGLIEGKITKEHIRCQCQSYERKYYIAKNAEKHNRFPKEK
jgi:hypothetical protein